MRALAYEMVRGLLLVLLGIAAANSIAHAQVKPVYSQDPVTGNATQQQQISVPAGFGITLQSGATLSCGAGASCGGAGLPFLPLSGGTLTGSLTVSSPAQIRAGSGGILGVGTALDVFTPGDITTVSAGRIGFAPSTNPGVAPDTYFTRSGVGAMVFNGNTLTLNGNLIAGTNGISGGTVSVGAGNPLIFNGEFGLTKITSSASAPGAGTGKMALVAGTNAGTCKLILFAGTSATPTTIIDNVGAGC